MIYLVVSKKITTFASEIRNNNNNPKPWWQQDKNSALIAMKKSLEEIAYEQGLDLITTTSEVTGYPSNLRYAIIGFDTYEQAEELAKEYDLSIEIFTKRDGWKFWYRTGHEAWEPFQRSAEDYGDDYHQYTKADLEDFYENEVQPFVEEYDDFTSLRDFLDNMEDVKERIEDAEDDEIVITCGSDYRETIKATTMAYEYDTHHYAIGLIYR